MRVIKMSFDLKVVTFALGITMLFFAGSTVLINVADIIAHGTYGTTAGSYAVLASVIAFIGSCFVFIGWHAEQPDASSS